MKEIVGTARGGRGGGRGGAPRGRGHASGGGRGGGRGDGGRGGRGGRGNGGRGRGGGGRGGVSRDPRFAGRSEPRFQQMNDARKEHDRSIKRTGDRVSALANDPRFKTRTTDSRGRVIPSRVQSNAANADEDHDGADEEEEDGDEEEEEFSGEEEEDEEGEEGEEGEEFDDDEVAIMDEEAADWSGSEVEEMEASYRVAAVNCDWDHIRPEDIFAVFFHSLPLGGKLESVKLYLSNFGREQLEYEKTHGPNLWIKSDDPEFQKTKEENEEFLKQKRESAKAYLEEFGEDGVAAAGEDHWDDDDVAMLGGERDDQQQENDAANGAEMFSSGRYRQYELNRMKYYYAICTFDCAETARQVYNACDGVDVEASGVALDLRYVPDEETFDETPIKTVTSLPPKFRPTQAFKNAALTQTRFQISWDQDDFSRTQRMADTFTGEDGDDDLAAYIATSESDDDDEAQESKRLEIRKKYASLLKGIVDLDDSKLPKRGRGLDQAQDQPSDDDEEFPMDDEEEEDEEEEEDFDMGDEEEEDLEFGDDEDEEEEDESDDDDLNRFSDVEFDDEEGDAAPGGDASGGVFGNVEGTIDFDEDDKAAKLQRSLQQKRAFENADMGTKDALRHKQKRKEGKAAKKEMLKQKRQEEIAEEKAKSDEARAALKAALGDSALDVEAKVSGRLRRKELGKVAKQKEAERRKDLKRSRVLATYGVTGDAAAASKATPAAASAAADSAAPTAEGTTAGAVVDSRFDSRLVSDPKFHIDVATRGRGGGKQDKALNQVASSIAASRRVKQATGSSAAAGSQQQPKQAGGEDGSANSRKTAPEDDAVDFFLSRPSKKSRR